jgi:DNA invertase Pin-like site-specific DNA recombinase
LGWAGTDIEVIDADLGLSGRSATHRDGFKQLVARVCLGEVGAVFGLEVSRLARSNADLARLLELARLTDTLVIDNDGVYDLGDINDRLVRHEALCDRVEVKDHHHRTVAAVR